MLKPIVMGVIALAAGAAHAFAFAPWNLPWLEVLALAVLFVLAARARSAAQAAALGFVFGLGWFGVGVSWVYISMHVYGAMPAPLAALATAAFCAFLSLYPALALAAAQRLASSVFARLAIALPAAWTLAEWLRGTLLTGFPWLASGYAHTDGPLAGYAAVVGVYGVTLAAALLAGALALLTLPIRQRGVRGYAWTATVLVLVLAGGLALRPLRWTEPAGASISVKLVQANIPQDTKFTASGLVRAFDEHWALMHEGPRADLVALPESVFPVPLEFVPPAAIEQFQSFARANRSGIVFGVFIEEPAGAYFNSAVGWAPEGTAWQRYSKQHLVPFGEFIPWGFRWFVDLMEMPIGDQQRGAAGQAPMELAGQRIAVNICYEDLFGHVIRRAWRDPERAPTVMLNLSNLAWFRDSIALPQHLQISRMRALETQHPMLRATNTGATAIIDERGAVIAELPLQRPGTLDGFVQGTEGLTPFLRLGNAPALLLSLLLAGVAAVWGRQQ
ncbi:MAG TPA: apolipoprotein N-acyltransferase [Burkholderiaceae bacterium]|nr:apolipoprotein N-acyltransferase [Burkholderiaceae bacterium]